MNKKLSIYIATHFAAAIVMMPVAAHAEKCFDNQATVTKAGNAAAVNGDDVLLYTDGKNEVTPKAGSALFSNQSIETGEASFLQMRLCDYSSYTVAASSLLMIDDIYVRKGAKRRRVVNYARGGLHIFSGKNTQEVDVEVKDSGVSAVVSGTSVYFWDKDDCTYVYLAGPKRDNFGKAKRGEITFKRDGEVVSRLSKAGTAACIRNNIVDKPFRIKDPLKTELYDAFSPRANTEIIYDWDDSRLPELLAAIVDETVIIDSPSVPAGECVLVASIGQPLDCE